MLHTEKPCDHAATVKHQHHFIQCKILATWNMNTHTLSQFLHAGSLTYELTNPQRITNSDLTMVLISMHSFPHFITSTLRTNKNKRMEKNLMHNQNTANNRPKGTKQRLAYHRAWGCQKGGNHCKISLWFQSIWFSFLGLIRPYFVLTPVKKKRLKRKNTNKTGVKCLWGKLSTLWGSIGANQQHSVVSCSLASPSISF